ncbi:MAG: peptidoglycan DD-metalloendopeptidase family protein [Eubacterium sp.]|nr:peptidoglycan DD-metalloendopeptidase family protein [Eubacterium sp.]
MKYKTAGKIRKAISMITVTATVLCVSASYGGVSADDNVTVDDIQQQIAQIEQENEQRRDEINSIEGEISENEENLEKVAQLLSNQKELVDYYNNLVYYKELDIEETEAKIAELETEISDVEAQIAEAEQQVAELEAENAENLEKFAEIVRAMYMQSDADLFGILAGSNNFYEMSVGTEVLNNITEKNLEFMNQLTADIEQLAEYKSQLETQKQQLADTKEDYIAQQQKLEDERDELISLQDDSQAAVNSYQNDYNNYQAAIKELESQQSHLSYLISVSNEEIEALEYEIKQLILAQQKPADSSELQDGAEWMWPLSTGFTMITCHYGWDADWGRWHNGTDIAGGGIYGANIYATKGGTVIVANASYGYNGGYGMYVVVDHGGGYTSLYAHMSGVAVYEGQEVSQGDVLGYVGDTGWASGPHLHFEIRINGDATDALGYVSVPY